MSRRRNHPAVQRELEGRLHAAMKKHGWLVPTTPEEVAEAEKQLWEIAPTTDVSEPPSFENIVAPAPKRELSLLADEEGSACVEETLARAAREGGHLPPEIEEVMLRDRDTAEAHVNDD